MCNCEQMRSRAVCSNQRSGPEERNDIYRSVRLFPEGHSARMRSVSGKGKTLLLHSKLDVRFGARLQQAD